MNPLRMAALLTVGCAVKYGYLWSSRLAGRHSCARYCRRGREKAACSYHYSGNTRLVRMRLWFKTNARFVLVLYPGTCLAQVPASGRGEGICCLGTVHAEPQEDMGESRT